MRKTCTTVLAVLAAIQLGGSPATQPQTQELVEATVLDARTGQPVTGAQVWLQSLPDETTLTDAKGRFHLSLQGCQAPCKLLIRSMEHLDHEVILPQTGKTSSLDNIMLSSAPGRLVGVLINVQGQRLANVPVAVTGGAMDPAWQRVTTSDPRGGFRVDRLPCDLPLEVSVHLDGYIPFAQVLEACSDGKDRDPVRDLGMITLLREIPVHGKVQNLRGEPVPHAVVFRDDNLRGGNYRGGRELLDEIAVADNEGRFSLRGLGDGEVVYAEIRAPGYVSETVQLMVTKEQPPLRVLLRDAACLEGRVLDNTSEPVPDVEVSLRRLGVETLETLSGIGQAAATSAADGRFRIEDLEPGDYHISTRSRSLARTPGQLMNIPAGEECAAVTLAVERGVVLEGRILAPDGTPVDNAMVLILDPSPPRSTLVRNSSGVTDEQGNFSLPPVLAGRTSISVSHPDFKSLLTSVDLEEDIWLELRFEEPSGVTLWGRVQDGSGSGVAGASIQLLPVYGGRSRAASSAPDGNFAIPRVPPGTYRVVGSIEDRVFTDPNRTLQVHPEGNEPLRLLALPGTQVTGRLLGLDREVLAQARIMAWVHRQVFGEVQPDGSFSVGPLAPGSWTIRASLPDGRTVTAGLMIVEDQREAHLDLEFEPTISMTVEILQGAIPLVGAEVHLQAIGRTLMQSAITDHLGQAHFPYLESGLHRLEVLDPVTLRPLHREEIETAEGAFHRVSLNLGQLRGTVRHSGSGAPLADVEILLESGVASRKAYPLLYTTDLSGNFHVHDLPPGNWHVVARKEGFSSDETAVELFPGESVAVELSLSPGEGLRIRLPLMPDLGLLDQVRVTLFDPSGHPQVVENTRILSRGRVDIPSAPAGIWDVLIQANRGMLAAELRGVRVPGSDVQAVLFQRGGLQIRVLPWIASAATGTVEFLDAVGHHPLGIPRLPLQGLDEVLGIPPGTWTMILRRDGSAETDLFFQRVVSVAPGEIQTIVVE